MHSQINSTGQILTTNNLLSIEKDFEDAIAEYVINIEVFISTCKYHSIVTI